MQLNMNEQMQQYQRTIISHKRQIDNLKNSNHNLTQQLQKVTIERNNYKLMVSYDPLYIIFQENQQIFNSNQHPMKQHQKQTEERIEVYRERVIQLQKQIINHKSTNQTYSFKINQLIKQNHNLSIFTQDLKRQNKILEGQIKIKNQSNEKLLTKLNQNHKLIENLRTQILTINKQTHQIQRQYNYHWVQCAMDINSLKTKWAGYANLTENSGSNDFAETVILKEQYKQLSQKFKSQQQVIQELGQQLQQRNQDLAKYFSVQGMSQDSNLKLDQHIMRNILNQQQKKQKVIKQLSRKYKQHQSHITEIIKERNLLEKQYITLKTKYQNLQNSMSQQLQLRQQYEKYKKLYNQTKTQQTRLQQMLVLLLRQNEVFHHFVHTQFGNDDYGRAVNKIRQVYEEGAKQRAENANHDIAYHYINITELFNMNKKLMNKIRERRH